MRIASRGLKLIESIDQIKRYSLIVFLLKLVFIWWRNKAITVRNAVTAVTQLQTANSNSIYYARENGSHRADDYAKLSTLLRYSSGPHHPKEPHSSFQLVTFPAPLA